MAFWKRNYTLTFGSATDTGLVRSENQDRCGVFEIGKSSKSRQSHLMIVADGMGGHFGGSIAAETAVTTVKDHLRSFRGDPRIALSEALKAAHERLVTQIAENPQLGDMGTTLSIVVYDKGKVYLAHIGDSRIYHANRNSIKQLSRDHSLANELLKSGAINSEQAANHPERNILMRALCGSTFMEPDIYEPQPVEKGDVFLVCSDGLWNMVSDDEIHQVIVQHEPQDAVDLLIVRANENGGSDNITAVIMKISE